jgi:hypothetical protein
MKLLATQITLWAVVGVSSPAIALPPATDLPEEYLRNQIITEARSPLDGQVMSAGEYADYVAQLEKATLDQEDRVVVNKYREAAFLLRLRKILASFGIRINAR